MSGKPAAIPLFADAYLADTMHLSTEEHGAYLLLLMAAWRQDDCSLPNDDRKLARIAGLSVRKWSSARTSIEFLFDVSGTSWRPRRVYLEGKRRPTLPNHLRNAILERDGDQCVYCGTTTGPFHFDHVMPRSRGGRDELDNLVRACWRCNLIKSDFTVEELGIPHPLTRRGS